MKKDIIKAVVLFFTLLLLFGSSRVCLADESTEIEPGWRVGPIIISMTKADIERVYGTGEVFIIPDEEKKANYMLLQYKNLGLNFIFKNDQISQMEVNYPNYQVKEVIKVGSTVSQVEETMGKNYIRENYVHSYQTNLPDYKMIYRGILFFIKQDRVVKITVVKEN
ncbi:MAG: hypothetical protein LWY06_07240 [Firmicutes bacterium]|nr:hypothetical protein [Bacillota bacterium]